MTSIAPPAQKVLVVEDEPGLREMLGILFRREGYEVVAAPGAKAALEAISQNPQPFPVVLSDLAIERLKKSPITELITTNSVPVRSGDGFPITELCIAELMGEGIKRINDDE